MSRTRCGDPARQYCSQTWHIRRGHQYAGSPWHQLRYSSGTGRNYRQTKRQSFSEGHTVAFIERWQYKQICISESLAHITFTYRARNFNAILQTQMLDLRTNLRCPFRVKFITPYKASAPGQFGDLRQGF